MTQDPDPGDDGAAPDCGSPGCGSGADFYRYEPETGDWKPVCDRHARELHPSLEVHAWLESGYLRPVERGRPPGPPDDPPGDRAAAFRDLVEDAMGW